MSIKQFRNVRVYRLNGDGVYHVSPPALDGNLVEHAAGPIGSHERETSGFVDHLGTGVFALMITPRVSHVSLLIQERILPSSVVNDAVAARIQEIEKSEDRTVSRRERLTLKDDVTMALLPQAFVKRTRVNALITSRYIFVDTSSATKAEMLLHHLRVALGTLKVVPFSTHAAPSRAMTEWVHTDEIESDYIQKGEAFKSRAHSAADQTLSGKGLNLSDNDLTALLKAGSHEVTEMELVYVESRDDRTPFTLTEQCVLKGIRWPEALESEISDSCGDDDSAVTQQRATLLLLSDALTKLVTGVAEALGGELLPDAEKTNEEDELV